LGVGDPTSLSLGGYFLDTESGSEGYPNGHFITGDTDAEVPDVPSPFTLALGQASTTVTLSLACDPAVVALGQTLQLQGQVQSDLPVSVDFKDEARRRLVLDPPGTNENAPGLFVSPAGASVTASYLGTVEGDHRIQLRARDATGQQIINRVVAGTITVDGTPPTLGYEFSDGSGTRDDGNAALWHSESSPTNGIVFRASDFGSGLLKIYTAINRSVDMVSDEPADAY